LLVQAAEEKRRRSREKSTVQKLVASRVIEDGAELVLAPTTEVSVEVREQLTRWLAADPRRGRARWYNRLRDPLKWEYDGQSYRPSPLVSHMLAEAAGIDRSVRGPAWWVLPDGRNLPVVAGGAQGGGSFDWERLHTVMKAIPAGRWASYGDLAQVIGTAAQPLGGHIASCASCLNTHRVLGSDGRVRSAFRWADPTETRDPEGLLRDEGVSVENGVADVVRRLTVGELEQIDT
jgi:alkylated DNA nucleotide flippase Atl1